jgi:hypothetical protein
VAFPKESESISLLQDDGPRTSDTHQQMALYQLELVPRTDCSARPGSKRGRLKELLAGYIAVLYLMNGLLKNGFRSWLKFVVSEGATNEKIFQVSTVPFQSVQVTPLMLFKFTISGLEQIGVARSLVPDCSSLRSSRLGSESERASDIKVLLLFNNWCSTYPPRALNQIMLTKP